VTYFADQHFAQELKQLPLPPEVITLLTGWFQNIFARALSADFARLPASVETLVTRPFELSFTVGLAQTYLLIALGIAVAGTVILLGMSKGLRGTFGVPFNQVQDESGKGAAEAPHEAPAANQAAAP
jgi:hypothetical protein